MTQVTRVNERRELQSRARRLRAGQPWHLRPVSSLAPWEIHAVHPADYMITLYSIAPDVVVAKLGDMARARNQEPRLYLEKLGRSVPAFATHDAESLGWSLDDQGTGL